MRYSFTFIINFNPELLLVWGCQDQFTMKFLHVNHDARVHVWGRTEVEENCSGLHNISHDPDQSARLSIFMDPLALEASLKSYSHLKDGLFSLHFLLRLGKIT